MNNVPKSLRFHIAIVGRMNSGKSSLLNLLTGQETSITSDVAGTTTDTVEKNQELHGFGSVTWIDTAGLDDGKFISGGNCTVAPALESPCTDNVHSGSALRERPPFTASNEFSEEQKLRLKRVEKTKKALKKADIAVVVCEGSQVPQEIVAEIPCPVIYVFNKADQHKQTVDGFWVNALDVTSRDTVLNRMVAEIKKQLGGREKKSLLEGLVPANGSIVLIMPIDAEAPKGRIIVPQVQAVRSALDLGLKVVCVQPEQYVSALENLKVKPDLVIADSQVLKFMLDNTPSDIKCTTFSILFARQKGDLKTLIAGAREIRKLKKGDRVLIAEACTHHAIQDDIARVKIPNLFKKRGLDVTFEWVTGSDFPADVSGYKLIIHCGACMFNETQMMNRIKQVDDQKTAITNYGLCMAELQGVMDRLTEVFNG